MACARRVALDGLMREEEVSSSPALPRRRCTPVR